jgi:hypothetical protein
VAEGKRAPALLGARRDARGEGLALCTSRAAWCSKSASRSLIGRVLTAGLARLADQPEIARGRFLILETLFPIARRAELLSHNLGALQRRRHPPIQLDHDGMGLDVESRGAFAVE